MPLDIQFNFEMHIAQITNYHQNEKRKKNFNKNLMKKKEWLCVFFFIIIILLLIESIEIELYTVQIIHWVVSLECRMYTNL